MANIHDYITWLPNPNINNMKKKQNDQKGAPLIRARPSGYTTNANPGPTEKNVYKIIMYITNYM